MKMNKKTIAIIVVVAVAAFLLWRRSKKSAGGATGVAIAPASASGSGLSKTNVDDVIEAAGLTGSKAETVRKEVKYLKSNLNWSSQIEDKAAEKGRTYEQQLVIEALYAFHYKNDDASWKIDKSQFEQYWHAIDAM